MILLSRIFKASSYSESEEKIILAVKASSQHKTEETDQRLQENEKFLRDAEAEARIIIRDAEEMAQKILQEAAQHAEQLKQAAASELESWIEEKRQEAQRAMEEERQQVMEQGYHAGFQQGMQQVISEEQQRVQTAREVLEQAYVEKEKILAEAEPFLIELSTEIAKKIIGEELALSPEKKLNMLSRVLRRSRVHGEITICVNHHQFEFIQEHRKQLLELLDGQAELTIYPDYTVQDEGCVIRTPLGSIDARIDLQLSEIKQVLLELARGSEVDELT